MDEAICHTLEGVQCDQKATNMEMIIGTVVADRNNNSLFFYFKAEFL